MAHTEEKKKEFWTRHKKVKQIRMIYRILGYVVYPFILRSKVREKVYKGNPSWYTKQLWYMLNDDEIARYGVDYDVKMIKREKPNYNLDTSWGRFKASYWFNADRNAGYNYLMSNPPYPFPITSYSKPDYPIDNIVIGVSVIKVDPLDRAEWVKKGKDIDWAKSKVGEGEVWYHPNGDESISLCRYSKAYVKKVLLWDVYITVKKGEFNGGRKFDTHTKIAKIIRR